MAAPKVTAQPQGSPADTTIQPGAWSKVKRGYTAGGQSGDSRSVAESPRHLAWFRGSKCICECLLCDHLVRLWDSHVFGVKFGWLQSVVRKEQSHDGGRERVANNDRGHA